MRKAGREKATWVNVRAHLAQGASRQGRWSPALTTREGVVQRVTRRVRAPLPANVPIETDETTHSRDERDGDRNGSHQTSAFRSFRFGWFWFWFWFSVLSTSGLHGLRRALERELEQNAEENRNWNRNRPASVHFWNRYFSKHHHGMPPSRSRFLALARLRGSKERPASTICVLRRSSLA